MDLLARTVVSLFILFMYFIFIFVLQLLFVAPIFLLPIIRSTYYDEEQPLI